MIETLSVETPEGTLDLTVELSPLDNTIVVSVDTPGWEDGYDAPNMGPRLRVWLNDYLMHEGVTLTHGAGPVK
jgi:hypothetical protein